MKCVIQYTIPLNCTAPELSAVGMVVKSCGVMEGAAAGARGAWTPGVQKAPP